MTVQGEFLEAILDLPVRYIDRSRAYYLALGYDNPYRWAHFEDVPFTPLSKPLSHCRVALISTAAPYNPEAGDQGPWAPYNARAKFTEVYTLPLEPLPTSASPTSATTANTPRPRTSTATSRASACWRRRPPGASAPCTSASSGFPPCAASA